MNNIIDNRNSALRTAEKSTERVSLSESSLNLCEKIVDVLESETADIVSRAAAGVASGVGFFAYAGALMNGSIGFFGAVIYGALIAACGIFAFRTRSGF